jgi:hypothetical protein
VTVRLAKTPTEIMRTVAEYQRYAEECRELAAKLTQPSDKRALEMMAAAWTKLADQRKTRLLTTPARRPNGSGLEGKPD